LVFKTVYISVVARLYILKGKSLSPRDTNSSDPYIIVKLGDTRIEDKDSLRKCNLNPGFFTSYDLPTKLPGPATLTIEVWDDDGFMAPDLIGATKIDLENRYFSREWRDKYSGKKPPIEERTLFITKSAAP
jgi:Ca2+-dependent lipid-binding protein